MIDFSKIPSPCFVLDGRALECNLAIVDLVRAASGAEVIVALKACAMWSIFPELARHSDGATASSLAEARLVFEEFGQKAHTYAPVYTDADFDDIVQCSSHLTFNSVAQWERFGQRAMEAGVSCGLRVNPGYSPVETDLYNPALPGSRLGIECLDELPEGIEGLHFHVLCESGAEHLARAVEAFEARFGHLLGGSCVGRRTAGETTAGAVTDAGAVTGAGVAAGGTAGSGPQLKWVNFGGGHLMTREGYDVELLVDTVRKFRERYPHLRVILEPGSAFTWRTGYLVSTVEDIVESGGIRTAMLDVSFACHMPDCLEMPYVPSVVGARHAEGEGGYRLGGNSCLAGDWMGEWVFDRGDLRVGDRVVFEDMIHYTMVKTTMFNGVRHPSIAVWTKGDKLQMVRQFGYKDFKNRMS